MINGYLQEVSVTGIWLKNRPLSSMVRKWVNVYNLLGGVGLEQKNTKITHEEERVFAASFFFVLFFIRIFLYVHMLDTSISYSFGIPN